MTKQEINERLDFIKNKKLVDIFSMHYFSFFSYKLVAKETVWWIYPIKERNIYYCYNQKEIIKFLEKKVLIEEFLQRFPDKKENLFVSDSEIYEKIKVRTGETLKEWKARTKMIRIKTDAEIKENIILRKKFMRIVGTKKNYLNKFRRLLSIREAEFEKHFPIVQKKSEVIYKVNETICDFMANYPYKAKYICLKYDIKKDDLEMLVHFYSSMRPFTKNDFVYSAEYVNQKPIISKRIFGRVLADGFIEPRPDLFIKNNIENLGLYSLTQKATDIIDEFYKISLIPFDEIMKLSIDDRIEYLSVDKKNTVDLIGGLINKK